MKAFVTQPGTFATEWGLLAAVAMGEALDSEGARLMKRCAWILGLVLCACGSVERSAPDAAPTESGAPDETPVLSDELELTGTHPKVAIADDGAAVVVWSHERELRSQRFLPDRGWEASLLVHQADSLNGHVEAHTLEMSGGRTLLTFVESGPESSRLMAAWEVPDGSWDPTELQDERDDEAGNHIVFSVSASLGPSGAALVSWLWAAIIEGLTGRELRFAPRRCRRHRRSSLALPEPSRLSGAGDVLQP